MGKTLSKAVINEKLKVTPHRTREELITLLDPPEDFPFEPCDKQVISRNKNRDCVSWGLVSNRYPVHMRYFNYMKTSLSQKKVPFPTEYEFTGTSFIQFVLDIGLPPEGYDDPFIQMQDKTIGFIASNLVWKDKTVQEQQRKDALLKKQRELNAGRECIVYNGQNFYLVNVNKQTEYIWDAARRGERTEGYERLAVKRRLLRRAVWEDYYGEVGRPRNLEYINPDGDLTDPFNMRLRHATKDGATKAHLEDFRQACADQIWGYQKMCAGCGATWRIIGKYVLDERLPLPREQRYGICEPHHDKNLKARKRWGNPGAVLRAGLTIPHAPIDDEEEDYSFQTRGERD